MKERIIQEYDDELDLQKLFDAILRKAWQISLVAILGAVVAFLVTFFLISPEYESSAMFYVNNNALSLGDASLSISSGDLTASKSLVSSYIVILETRESLVDVIDYAGIDRSVKEVRRMISANAVNSTEIFRVTVTSTDPQEAEKIADAIAYILPKRISNIIEGTSAKVVDSAVLPAGPSGPSYVENVLIGFILGFMLSTVVVVWQELKDTTIREEEDITDNCKYPILASVPDMEAPSKGGDYYGYGRAEPKSRDKKNRNVERVGLGVSFAAAEAYKLLRTKLQYSFASEGGCKVIGVSSALTGEGKSLSSVNLAYTTSQLGKRVLLIDCDMRRPTLAEKLPIRTSPGLSDFLSGQSRAENLLQLCGMKDAERAFHVISSGQMPPNPMELLGSERMEKAISLLRNNYDYIILDLPPVSEVGDALAVSKLTDGMLLVVRQNYCDRVAMNAAVRQFEFVDAKILGVVFNYVQEAGSRYSNKNYRKYYKSYDKKRKSKAAAK